MPRDYFEHYLDNGELIKVPFTYQAPLSDAVTDAAQKIASDYLGRSDYGDDWPLLYRHVRKAMGRRDRVDIERPTQDDESISRGIVNAINAR